MALASAKIHAPVAPDAPKPRLNSQGVRAVPRSTTANMAKVGEGRGLYRACACAGSICARRAFADPVVDPAFARATRLLTRRTSDLSRIKFGAKCRGRSSRHLRSFRHLGRANALDPNPPGVSPRREGARTIPRGREGAHTPARSASMRRASRRGRLARVLAASALARLGAAYETVVRDGALVLQPTADGSTWTAAVATPALASPLGANADAVPGALALAPGGALRVTRATRAIPPDPDPDVAAVLVLGARAPREGREPTRLTLDVRVSPAHPENTSPPAWTSCDLTLDHLGVWRASIARDDPADSSRAEGVPPAACTVVPLADSGDAITSTINSGDDSSSASVLIRARVEVSPSLVSAETNVSIDSRVDVVALASTATNRDAVVKVVVESLAIVRASDLVELAWVWVSRAARCAAELFGDVLSACGGEGGEGGGRETDGAGDGRETGGAGDGRDPTPDLGRSSPFDRARADALVRGCCAAVASYANAGCDCASRVVPTETLLVGETLAAARDASAARSLAKLCGAEEKEEEGVDRADDEESGCVAESATLAAVRAFVARDAAANAPNAAVASYANDTARDPVVVAAATASASQSDNASQSDDAFQSDDAYGAFLEWLGREDESSRSATPPPPPPPPRPRAPPTIASPTAFPTTKPPADDVSAVPAVPAVAPNTDDTENTGDDANDAPDARHGHGAWSNGWEAGAAAGAAVATAAFAAFAARRGWSSWSWSSWSSKSEARGGTRLVRPDVEGAVLVARRVVPGKASRGRDRT